MTTRTERSIAVLLAAAALVGWACLARHAMPYTTDSAAYLEAGRSVARGEGFLVTTYGIRPVAVDRHPLELFPPGYSLAIAGTTALGVSATIAAVAWPGLAFACLPLLQWRLFRRVVTPATALVAAGMSTWTAGTVVAALHAWSDVPFLALAVASLDVMLLALARRSISAACAAGALVGAACLTRNVGYALVAGHGVGFVVAAALGVAKAGVVARAGAAWVVGCAASYGWWLVRNVLVLGAPQPYTMSPSELGLAGAAAQATRAAAAGLFGTTNPLAAWAGLAIVGAVLVHAAAAGLRESSRADAGPNARMRAVAWSTLVAYGAAGLLLVIVARARYAWGEEIGERHVLQYQWIALLALAAAFARASPGRAWMRLAGTMLVAAFLVAQTRPIARQLRHARDHALPELATIERLAPRVVAGVPAGALVASNVAPLLRIATDLPVRQINAAATPDALREAIVPTRELYLVLAPCETFCRGLYPDGGYPAWLDTDPTTLAGYEIVERTEDAVLLRAVRP